MLNCEEIEDCNDPRIQSLIDEIIEEQEMRYSILESFEKEEGEFE